MNYNRNLLIRRILFLILVFALGTFLLTYPTRVPSKSNVTPSPLVSSSPAAASVSAQIKPTPKKLSLDLPFDVKNFSPQSFGVYPFGVKSTEHPDGHAGINFELIKGSSITAPADLTILTIAHPPGRVDEYNLVAQVGDYRLEILRLGSITMAVQLNASLKKGDVLGQPGFNTASNVYQFHIGVTNNVSDAYCPNQDYWLDSAWQQIQIMLHSSSYQTVCVIPGPILHNTRSLE